MIKDMPSDEPVTDVHAPLEVLAAIRRGIAKAREECAASLSDALSLISADLKPSAFRFIDDSRGLRN
jgi:hypothetical protein